MGRPDLTRFTKPVAHYIGYVEAYLTSLRTTAATGDGLTPGATGPEWQAHAYRKGVLGQWGLITRGPSESLPYVLGLLSHPLPEARQTAAAVLAEWTSTDLRATLATHALTALDREAARAEPDVETLTTLIGLLGRLKSRDALPSIARPAPLSRISRRRRGLRRG